MIRKFIPVVAIFCSVYSYAQLGVGTRVPQSSALLEVKSTEHGILLPRVTLQSLDIASPIKGEIVESLLVYNLPGGSLPAGFYYWSSSKWVKLLSGQSIVDTTNKTFTLNQDKLVITDSSGNTVELDVREIANNSSFVTNLVDNKEFINYLGDSIDFINQITQNQEFIENIVNKLTGTYGNVGYDSNTKQFYYFDAQGKRVVVNWSDLDTTNVSFVLQDDQLTITDSKGAKVSLKVEDIATNSTFVTKLAQNNEFITQLGDNVDFINQITQNNEFIENIVNRLTGTYGNVGYDTTTKELYYLDIDGKRVVVNWSDLDTTNVSFVLQDDQLTITDSKGAKVSLKVEDIATNSTFVNKLAQNNEFITSLIHNNEFITQLGDNIDFINQITQNNEFIENIVNQLTGTYGNVGYDPDLKNFYYYNAQGNKTTISWSDLDTTNVSFTLEDDLLTLRDSKGGAVSLPVEAIATNSTFVTKLGNNKEFITQLGDNIDFINQITQNNEFIENIVNKLTGTYGNVGYDQDLNSFYYYNSDGQKTTILWSDLDTTNISFTLIEDLLTIRDSKGGAVTLPVDQIATNSTFVTKLAHNNEFITQLGENIDFINQITQNNEFIENIVNKLTGTYGNVGYDSDLNSFYYYNSDGEKTLISWSDLDTTNVSFVLQGDQLTITDSKAGSVSLPVDQIATNSTFVTKLAHNNEFITQLGDNIDFINHITQNNEFIENIVNKLIGTYGNVGYDEDLNNFYYYNAHGEKTTILWSDLDTTNVSFTLENDLLTVRDSKAATVTLPVEDIATNAAFITKLANNKEFITQLGDNIDFINQITQNNEFIENIINQLTKKYGNVGYDTVNNEFYYLDENGDKQTIDLQSAVKLYQTLTSLENVVTQQTDQYGQEIDVYTLTYKDENGNSHPIDINVLVKGNETLTTLTYDPIEHVLLYKDEQENVTKFKLTDLVGDAESLTKLEFDPETNSLLFTDENQVVHTLELDSINKHPWYDSLSNKPAIDNTSNIYTKGWVGIGYSEPSGAPNERLRVNGSITAVNSYYADYVFENYFDGYSSLKYDYDFKTLDAVADYIKENRHLPGITPINQLTKLEEGYAFNVSELSIQLLEKTEELYLHIIDQNNQLEQISIDSELKALQLKEKELRIDELEKANEQVQQKIERLEQMLLQFIK